MKVSKPQPQTPLNQMGNPQYPKPEDSRPAPDDAPPAD